MSPPTPGIGDGPVVLDASAVLAWLKGETGADRVEKYLSTGVMSAVNFSEAWQKLQHHGVDADRAAHRLRVLGLHVEPLDVVDAVTAARLWPSTRRSGLSLGDRCCLALASRLEVPAITADAAWADLDLDIAVELIR